MNDPQNAQELNQAVTEARQSEFGDQYGAPTKFYDGTVFVAAPDGRLTQRSPFYCATEYATQCVLAVLENNFGFGDMTVEHYAAMAFSGWGDKGMDPSSTDEEKLRSHGWTETKLVPYIRFTQPGAPGNGVANVANLLGYFNHGYPAKMILDGVANELQFILKLEDKPSYKL